MRPTISVFALAGLAILAGAGCSSADNETKSELTLTVSAENRPDTARTVTLTCKPDVGGNHPAAAQACTELDAVNGDLAKLNVNPDTICAQIYEPVVYTAAGTWRDQPVAFTKTFPNDCQGKGLTGSVFAF